MEDADYRRIEARIDGVNERIDGVFAAIDDIKQKLKS